MCGRISSRHQEELDSGQATVLGDKGLADRLTRRHSHFQIRCVQRLIQIHQQARAGHLLSRIQATATTSRTTTASSSQRARVTDHPPAVPAPLRRTR